MSNTYDESNSEIKQTHLSSQQKEKLEKLYAVATNSRDILDNLDEEFEKIVELDKKDISFLFFCVALQCIRIYFINDLTKIENAGDSKLEKKLKKYQSKILKKFGNPTEMNDGFTASDFKNGYYASLEQIISTPGVPYDATRFNKENTDVFKGGNHRFSTLGHDPILGLIFGTVNILTNTITFSKKPLVFSHHVIYDVSMKNPEISAPALTTVAINSAIDRDAKEIIAAIIKQIIHIGTDLFTPCGIQIPGLNLTTSTGEVDEITKIISMGDILKMSVSSKIAQFVNMIITTLHIASRDKDKFPSAELYSVKTKKIINYSNIIAQSSNVVATLIRMCCGDEYAIKSFDVGGFIVMTKTITQNKEIIRDIKKEFIDYNFINMITSI